MNQQCVFFVLFNTEHYYKLTIYQSNVIPPTLNLSFLLVFSICRQRLGNFSVPFFSFNIYSTIILYCSFSFGHCVVCPSIHGFWLHLWYLQTLLNKNHTCPYMFLAVFLTSRYKKTDIKQWWSTIPPRFMHNNDILVAYGNVWILHIYCGFNFYPVNGGLWFVVFNATFQQ
jgi:hypothetical protein